MVATDVNARALRIARLNAALNGCRQHRGPGRLVLRAGRRGALRPDRHQPAVRDLAGDRRAAGLPRLRAARRPVVEHIVRTAPAHLDRRRLVPGPRQLGGRPRPPVGGAARRLADRRVRCVRGAARGARPRGVRRALAQGRGPARRPRLPRPLRHLAVVVRRPAHRGGRVRLAQPAAPAGRRRRPTRSSTGRTRSSSRSPRRSLPGARPSTSASDPDDLLVRRGRRAAGDGRCARRRGPRGRACCASSAGCVRARRADTVEAALVGACDGDLTVGQILRRPRAAARPRPRRAARDVPPRRRASSSSRGSSPTRDPRVADMDRAVREMDPRGPGDNGATERTSRGGIRAAVLSMLSAWTDALP